MTDDINVVVGDNDVTVTSTDSHNISIYNSVVGDNDVTVTESSDTISVNTESSLTTTAVLDDTPLYLNTAQNTYLKYNSTTSRLELWVNGSKVQEWS